MTVPPRPNATPRDATIKRIEKAIYLIRDQKVMLDVDLAQLYGVTTGNLNKAARRNRIRFPADFSFQLNGAEFDNLRFQIGRASWGGRRVPPFAFTEQGVAMLSSVLRSERAVLVNIEIMRAFVRLRELMLTHHDLARKLDELQQKYSKHERQFAVVFDAIRRLIEEPPPAKRRIGFHPQGKLGVMHHGKSTQGAVE